MVDSVESFREAEESGVRYRVHREGQVLGLEAEDPWSADLMATLQETTGGSRFVSAAALALKAKQVDDGLYAAVDLAAQRGLGTFRGKRALLEGVLDRLAGDGMARATIEAAASLGSGREPATAAAQSVRAQFLADELRSRPIGFYTWSEELGRVFQQDRLLQTDLADATDLAALAAAIHTDPVLQASYEAALRLPERLTNALACADLRGALDAQPIAFLPASRAHETQLVKRLFGDRPIPEAFDLSRALISAVRSREIDLTPAESSGWYDVQTWALETLVAPERGAESERLTLGASYLAHLEEMFRGILTATRETHIKQLEIPMAGSAAPRVTKLHVAPHLTVEPLVTYYQRRADSYRFVRALLAELFGEQALEMMHGLRQSGPVHQPLGVELASMVHLFDGAAATSMRELGMPTTWDNTAFEAWRGGAKDVDVGADMRAMVPVFFDVARKKTKVWMILGWSQRMMAASFARPPRVEILGASKAEVELTSARYPLATPVMVEAYVSRIVDRDEFRAICDKHRTKDAIVRALA